MNADQVPTVLSQLKCSPREEALKADEHPPCSLQTECVLVVGYLDRAEASFLRLVRSLSSSCRTRSLLWLLSVVLSLVGFNEVELMLREEGCGWDRMREEICDRLTPLAG